MQLTLCNLRCVTCVVQLALWLSYLTYVKYFTLCNLRYATYVMQVFQLYNAYDNVLYKPGMHPERPTKQFVNPWKIKKDSAVIF